MQPINGSWGSACLGALILFLIVFSICQAIGGPGLGIIGALCISPFIIPAFALFYEYYQRRKKQAELRKLIPRE